MTLVTMALPVICSLLALIRVEHHRRARAERLQQDRGALSQQTGLLEDGQPLSISQDAMQARHRAGSLHAEAPAPAPIPAGWHSPAGLHPVQDATVRRMPCRTSKCRSILVASKVHGACICAAMPSGLQQPNPIQLGGGASVYTALCGTVSLVLLQASISTLMGSRSDADHDLARRAALALQLHTGVPGAIASKQLPSQQRCSNCMSSAHPEECCSHAERLPLCCISLAHFMSWACPGLSQPTGAACIVLHQVTAMCCAALLQTSQACQAQSRCTLQQMLVRCPRNPPVHLWCLSRPRSHP